MHDRVPSPRFLLLQPFPSLFLLSTTPPFLLLARENKLTKAIKTVKKIAFGKKNEQRERNLCHCVKVVALYLSPVLLFAPSSLLLPQPLLLLGTQHRFVLATSRSENGMGKR
jgi:hypothetical protein